jgi:hypothetical protein
MYINSEHFGRQSDTCWTVVKFKMALMQRRFNYITMILVKSQDTAAKFQTMYFVKYFELLHSCLAHCIMSQGDCTEESSFHDSKCCYQEAI